MNLSPVPFQRNNYVFLSASVSASAVFQLAEQALKYKRAGAGVGLLVSVVFPMLMEFSFRACSLVLFSQL